MFCKTGFQFVDGSNDTECEDIKECSQEPNPCSQNCTELEGGFACFCGLDGFRLDTDQVTCIECTEGTFGDDCNQSCSCIASNTASCDKVSGTCTCNPGWNGTLCENDIDECTDGTDGCPENSTCVNTPGSFRCQCNDGFVFGSDRTCRECDEGFFSTDCATPCTCDPDNTADCDNVNGSCTCNPGWTGENCTSDINECNTSNVCDDDLKTCSNTAGSFVCTCLSGYTINSDNVCIDDDECLRGTDDCIQQCTNIPGSFNCSCFIGNTGTGNNCTPCETGKYGVQCVETCYCVDENTVECNRATGCVCESGWQGLNCSEDIDECTAGTSNCPENSDCQNSNGSFTCICRTGYSKDMNDNCIACSGDTYGTNCSQTCDCENDNAANSTQSCNHVTGVCECKPTWNGTRCEIDVDECTEGTDQCDTVANRGCHNFAGGFECSCNLGYELASDGNCTEITGTTTAVAPQAGETSSRLTVTFTLVIPPSADLNVTLTYEIYVNATQQVLLEYFQQTMGISVLSVTVLSIRRGSTIVDANVIIVDNDSAKRQYAEAVTNLAINNATVTILGEETAAESVQIGGATSDLSTLTEKDIKCAVLFSTVGPCPSKQECQIIAGAAVCQPVETSDNFGLVVGLGVGIPLFFIAALIITIIIIYTLKMRKRRRYSADEIDRETFNNGFFPTGMPTKINTWGRGDPVYGPQVWEDDSSSTSTDDKYRRHRHRDNDREPEMYAYDNGMMSNFSWDFLYNYINPHERYEIQRPRTDLDPHPMYTKM